MLRAFCFAEKNSSIMAEAIVSLAIETLGGLILPEAGRTLCGGRDELVIQNAREELVKIRPFLKDAERRSKREGELRNWVAQVNEAACDLEDVIACYRNRGISSVNIAFATCIGPCSFDVRKTYYSRRLIKRIIAHLVELRSKFSSHGIVVEQPGDAVEAYVSERRTPTTTSSHGIGQFVSREEEVCKLVKQLVGEEENSPRVVSVWGMGSIGKTTIAAQVYRHWEVRRHFDCMAWVCVSPEFQSRDVFENMLVMFSGANDEERCRREISRMKAQEIVTELHTIQQHKRCLVVLDDIWTRQAWDSLKPGFPLEKTKTKILLTTGNRELALHAADTNVFLYEAQPLSENESWLLFKNIAIAEGDDSTDSTRKKEKLGRNMLQSCGGQPLAIIVLAGLLARKNTVEEWITVSENVEEYLTEGRHIESIYEGTSWVLALSYDSLPERLKICFQYLGNFPKDYEIPVKTLNQLWMAEGLIAPVSLRSAESIEDASYGYLNELVQRCMVQVVEHTLTGNIKTIRLHDLMLELCRKKAERENFLHIVNSFEATQTQAASVRKVRRLAVHLDGIGHELAPPSDERHASLRSLLFFVQGHYYSDKYRKLLRSLCRDFKLLRVLKFEDMKAEPEVELPSNIGNLVHLRYLSLKNSEIKRLPSSVANLVCLQTLDLRSVEWVSVKIPNVFWKMEQLRHLYLPLNHRVTEKLSLATLQKLQTLVNISSQDCDLKDLIELTSLRKLVLHAREPTEFKTLEDIMRDRSSTFGHLRSLSLVAGNGIGDISTQMVLSCPHLLKLQLCGGIKEFPEVDHFSNLIKLTLEETDLQECHIERLEKLPKLKALSLRMGAFKSETMVFSEGSFRQLEYLSLIGLSELKEWTVERGAMPILSKLHIGYCWGLRAVPDGLQHISTLKNLSINHMYRQFCNRIEKGGADFDKVKHASVTITDSREIQEKA